MTDLEHNGAGWRLRRVPTRLRAASLPHLSLHRRRHHHLHPCLLSSPRSHLLPLRLLGLHLSAIARPPRRRRPGPAPVPAPRRHCCGAVGAGSPRLLLCRGQGTMLSGEGRVRRSHLPAAAAAPARSPGRCRPPARRR